MLSRNQSMAAWRSRYAVPMLILVLSGATSSLAAPQTNVVSNTSDSSSSSSSSTSTMTGSGANMPPFPPLPAYFTHIRTAHAVLASAAWLIFFPLGAALIRSYQSGNDYTDVKIHACVQMAGYFVFAVAAGMGIWMAKTIDMLGTYHPIIGMVLLGGLALQPMTELLNARFYRKHPRMIFLAHVHLWFGRLLIIAGIVQGGLGFVFAASFPGATADPAPRIAYGVLAVVVWILYVSFGFIWPEVKHHFGWWRRRQNRAAEEGEALHNRGIFELPATSETERSSVVWK